MTGLHAAQQPDGAFAAALWSAIYTQNSSITALYNIDTGYGAISASAHQQSVCWRIGCSSLNVSAQAPQTTRCASCSLNTVPQQNRQLQRWSSNAGCRNSRVEEQSAVELAGLPPSRLDSDSAVSCSISQTPAYVEVHGLGTSSYPNDFMKS